MKKSVVEKPEHHSVKGSAERPTVSVDDDDDYGDGDNTKGSNGAAFTFNLDSYVEDLALENEQLLCLVRLLRRELGNQRVQQRARLAEEEEAARAKVQVQEAACWGEVMAAAHAGCRERLTRLEEAFRAVSVENEELRNCVAVARENLGSPEARQSGSSSSAASTPLHVERRLSTPMSPSALTHGGARGWAAAPHAGRRDRLGPGGAALSPPHRTRKGGTGSPLEVNVVDSETVSPDSLYDSDVKSSTRKRQRRRGEAAPPSGPAYFSDPVRASPAALTRNRKTLLRDDGVL